MNSNTQLAINSISPGHQVYEVGTKLGQALNQFNVRDQSLIRYVDANVAVPGDGTSHDKAYNRFYDGITWLNTQSGKGATLIVKPGFYIEKASNIPDLTASDCLIKAVGLPEDTVIFASSADDTVGTADDDLLTIKGGNNHIFGLGLYVHSNTKSSIVFDDTGAGYAGSFNRIEGCYFSPQAQDGLQYCIKYAGGNANQILNNIFYGAKDAAILLTGNVGNPVRNIISGNHFVGTNVALAITSANYNTLFYNNWCSAGSQSGEGMTNAVTISAGMNAGAVTFSNNFFEQSAANDISDSKTGGSVFEMNNFNGA